MKEDRTDGVIANVMALSKAQRESECTKCAENILVLGDSCVIKNEYNDVFGDIVEIQTMQHHIAITLSHYDGEHFKFLACEASPHKVPAKPKRIRDIVQNIHEQALSEFAHYFVEEIAEGDSFPPGHGFNSAQKETLKKLLREKLIKFME